MSLLVTGTDTGVGKTVVCALILLRYADSGPAYWKPVATGSDGGRDAADVERWTDAPILPEAYLFGPPVSPHLAARLAGKRINRRTLLRRFSTLRDNRTQGILVEGIGGVMVPFDERGYFFADFARDLSLPVVVVARSTIGTINHTLLTLASLRSRRVRIAGVVLNGPKNVENRRAIERFGKTRVLAEVTPMGRISAAPLRRAAKRFDIAGTLKRYLS